MAKRECVNLFDDQLEVVSFLTDEQLGRAVRAAMQFVRDGAEPKLDGPAGMFFQMLRAQCVRQHEDVANGSKGGRPRKDKTPVSDEENPGKTPVLKSETNNYTGIDYTKSLSSGFADREPDKPESEKRTKKVFPPDSDAYLAACCLRDEIAARLPTASPPSEKQLQAWADAFDKCNRIDGHDWEEIERVLLFSQSDKFWQQNILSGEKFRKQYTALLARMGGG